MKGLLFTTKAALALFPEEGGSVINISSVVATRAFPGSSIYSATKGAVDTITRVLAAELGAKKIRVNALSPGMVVTEGAKSLGLIGSDFEKQAIAGTPLGRTGQPDDIADVALFLASDDARWVNGSILEECLHANFESEEDIYGHLLSFPAGDDRCGELLCL